MVDKGCRGGGTREGNECPGDRGYRPVLFQLQIGLWEGRRLSAYGRSNSFSCVHGDPGEGSWGSSVRALSWGEGPVMCWNPKSLDSSAGWGPRGLRSAAPSLARVGPVWPQCGPGGSPAAGLTPRGQWWEGPESRLTFARNVAEWVSECAWGSKNNNMTSLCWAHGQVQRPDPAPRLPIPAQLALCLSLNVNLPPARSPGRVRAPRPPRQKWPFAFSFCNTLLCDHCIKTKTFSEAEENKRNCSSPNKPVFLCFLSVTFSISRTTETMRYSRLMLFH